MPQFCAVINCGSKSGTAEKLSFFRIPSEKDSSGKVTTICKKRRERWILQLKRADLTESILKNDRICSKHFITGKPSDLYDTVNLDWAPTLHMGYKTNNGNLENKLQRYERSNKRKRMHECVVQPVEDENISSIQEEEEDVREPEHRDNEKQLNNVLQQANLKIYNLEAALKKTSFDRDGFASLHL